MIKQRGRYVFGDSEDDGEVGVGMMGGDEGRMLVMGGDHYRIRPWWLLHLVSLPLLASETRFRDVHSQSPINADAFSCVQLPRYFTTTTT